MNVYPNFPGFKGTDTSYEAAQAVSEHLGRLQAKTYAAIDRAGGPGRADSARNRR